MAHHPPPAHRRALIVEDEIMFALNLEADMLAMALTFAISQQMDNKLPTLQ